RRASVVEAPRKGFWLVRSGGSRALGDSPGADGPGSFVWRGGRCKLGVSTTQPRHGRVRVGLGPRAGLERDTRHRLNWRLAVRFAIDQGGAGGGCRVAYSADFASAKIAWR